MNYMRDYMKEVKRIRDSVTDSYNKRSKEQYESSKVTYIKQYYD